MRFFDMVLQVAAMVGGAAAAVTTYVSDTFNRADSAVSLGSADVGGAWTASVGTWGISSNVAYQVADAGQDVAQIDSTVANCTIRCTYSVASPNSQRIIFRFSDTSNYWLLQTEGGTAYKLYKYVAAAFTLAGTYSTTPANGDVLMIVLNGNQIDAYLNGVLRISTTDAHNSTATRHGIGGANNSLTGRWEDFSVKSA